MLPRGFCDECSPGTALNSAAAGSITRYPLGTMPDGELPSDLLQLMVHRLEAQERASARMMERANSYAVFSLAVLGFYVGILFARSDSPSALLLVGAGAIASLFLATLILFYRVHKAADLSVLPNPRDLAAQADTKAIPEAIVRAYETNVPIVRSDQTLNTCLLATVGVQVFVFLAVTLIELFG